jgi:CheY-like chemotaxis protein
MMIRILLDVMTAPRILIVEDEVVVAMYIETVLSSFGFDVVGTVTNGEDAQKLVREASPDLVLMDINIEGDYDGIETTRRIKSFSAVPVIFVSAYIDKETKERASDTEPAGYLAKPFKNKELRDIINETLAKD